MMQFHLPVHLFRHEAEAAHHLRILLYPASLSMQSAHFPAAASDPPSDPDSLSPDVYDILPAQ